MIIERMKIWAGDLFIFVQVLAVIQGLSTNLEVHAHRRDWKHLSSLLKLSKADWRIRWAAGDIVKNSQTTGRKRASVQSCGRNFVAFLVPSLGVVTISWIEDLEEFTLEVNFKDCETPMIEADLLLSKLHQVTGDGWYPVFCDYGSVGRRWTQFLHRQQALIRKWALHETGPDQSIFEPKYLAEV